MEDKYKQHGAFSWNELMTSDPKAAADFYSKLFNWTTEDWDMGEMTYTVAKIGDDGVGGIMAMPPQAEGAPPTWGAYITVDDVDTTVRKAEELGAKILNPPNDIPDVGRMATLQDPQGAVISIMTYKSEESE